MTSIWKTVVRSPARLCLSTTSFSLVSFLLLNVNQTNSCMLSVITVVAYRGSI